MLWVNIGATVVGVLALAAILVALHLGQLYDIFNSDASYLPLVLEDILADPANFRHWYPSTNSYYFPEWILFGLPYLITRSFYFSMAVVIVLHTLILFAVVYGINRQIDRSQAWVASVATTVLLLFLGLQDHNPYTPVLAHFRLMFNIMWHYGTLLMCLLSLWLLVKLHTRAYTKRQYVVQLSLLGLVVVLTTMSDQIMLVWFAGPAIATLGYQWLITPTHSAARGSATNRGAAKRGSTTRGPAVQKKRIYYTMGVVALVSIAGKLFFPLIVVHDFATRNTRISLSGLVGDARTMIVHTLIELASFPVVTYWIIGLHLLVLVGLVCQKRFASIPAPLRFSMVYTFMTFITIVAAILFTHSQSLKRYFLPTYILPIILLPSLVIHWCRHRSSRPVSTKWISCALLIVCGVLLQVTVLRIIQKNDEINPGNFAYTFGELQCIDQVIARYNLRYGVAAYDYASALQAMSTHDIQVALYSYDKSNLSLTEFHWITSVKYFRDSYDFAIAGVNSYTNSDNHRWRQVIFRDHPPPLHRAVCGSKEVFIYPNGGLVMDYPINTN